MSETLSQDPDGLGVAYTTLAPSYPSTPATPSSTVQDLPPGANLPPFSTFAAEMDSNGTFSSVSDRLFSDTRLLDISNWDYYTTETRLIERGENGLSIITSQPQYRPWESKPVDSTSQVTTFAESFANQPQNGASKLPSFQSQFQAFSEANGGAPGEPTLTTLTNLTPVSPNSVSSPQSQTLTTLNSSFHTLSAARSYPLVPAPIQAREIPSIQQQFLDERHIQLYSHPTTNLTLNNAIHFPAQNGAIIQNSQIISSPAMVTVLKSEPDLKLGSSNLTTLHQTDPAGLKLQNVALHAGQFQNPMTLNSDNGLYNGIEKKMNNGAGITSPTRNDFRKKERRKMRANSLESSAESDGASSNMDLNSENSGQVAAVSSTDGFKSHQGIPMGMEHDITGGAMDKQVKKKRKRCGECIGCQRKDNCGDCAPCRNDKSHQICKQRRCEKLTEKKSYRGRKPSGPLNSLAGGLPPNPDTNGGVAPPTQPPTRPSPQPVAQPMPVQQQPMTPMPFYADPNRFPTPVWQTDPSQVSGWQGQFIQQIPQAAQPIETYQQYPNGIYQTTYQQPAFETNAFYTGAVQVLTPTNTRPPSVPSQQAQMVPPRPNSNYAHTPSPSPANQGQQQQQPTQQQQNPNRQYQEYNQFGSNTNNTNSESGSQSRPSSVNSVINQNPSTPNQNYQQQQQQQPNQSQNQQQTVYATVSSGNFSPGANSQQQTQQYVNAGSGNGQPGYPQVNTSSPQVVSHNSSGYPGNEQYSGQQQQQWQQQQPQEQMMWEQHQDTTSKMDQQHSYQQHVEHQDQNNHYMSQQQNDHSEHTSPTKMKSDGPQKTFSQADKVNLNTRIKTMILNKQQSDVKMEQSMKNVEQNQPTGHFLWFSHHHHLDKGLSVDGGPLTNQTTYHDHNTQKFAQTIIKSDRFSPFHRESIIQKNNFQLTSEAEALNNRREACRTPQSPSITSVNSPKTYSPSQSTPSPRGFSNSYDSGPNFLPQSPLHEHADSLHSPQRSIFASPQPSDIWLQEKQRRTPQSPRQDPNVKQNKKPASKPSPERVKVKKEPQKVIGEEIPECQCFPPEQNPPEPGAYYTHLGCANNLRTLRYNLECQTGHTGAAIRIEKIRYTGKEGKTAQGCPIVKWVHRRVNLEEKYLVIVKQRQGHTCRSSFIIVCLVVWEGVANNQADHLYSLLTNKLTKFGLPTKRRCATNEPRTCACQGVSEETCGASFSFGCSWSMYYNGCKFTRSKEVRKYRLSVKEEEYDLENELENLADHIHPMYRSLAPKSFENQTVFESIASECRLGRKPGRPFSGVTACMDFCAHAHKDIHNMVNGCTVVVTLTKHRGLEKPEDEQLHVLPMFVPDTSDEFGSEENQQAKVVKGEVEVLNKYHCEVRTFSEPAEKCKNRKSKKEESQRKRKSSSPSISSSTSLQRTPSTPPGPYGGSSQEIQSGQISSTVLDSPVGYHHLPQFSVFKAPYNYQEYYYPYDSYQGTPNLWNHFNPHSPQINNPFDDFYTNDVKGKTVDIRYTDNSECFRDQDIGGVAIALTHGSVLFECAKHELHATTALKQPDRTNPTRISLVFYQHRSLNKTQHGLDEYTLKQKIKLEGGKVPSEDSGNFQNVPVIVDHSEEVGLECDTLPTYTYTTMFPMYPCMVAGAYRESYNGTTLPK
ncbi:DNA N6-methyl adenine demethylase isoform X2 [Anthonomus grandis grandis]|uniref:DNA N6-methyl adenine demethylase isoform X2 n=1 Tax=Anthonomus grandis grandis TaxID=2921223 RepID=UPI0021667D6F|nr:DNA N6-methyl adenine demethylase isoform X2 [Anthonomus grandis grandis]